jgi:hypothetical protein
MLRAAAFIEPCLPSPADKPPSGSNWIHEIKHDGYRLMARRDPVGIRLITRRGERLDDPLPASRGGREPPQGAVLPDRRRGCGPAMRRAWLPSRCSAIAGTSPQAATEQLRQRPSGVRTPPQTSRTC